MSWNYDNIVTHQEAPAPEAAPVAPVAPPVETRPLDATEMENISKQIESYSAHPSIQSEISKLASAHQGNPEHLATLVRELSDAIEAVRSNPHMVYHVSPEIKHAVEEVRKVELEKPDPLNLLREGGASLATLFTPETPEKSAEERTLAGPFAYLDMGSTTAALAYNMPPVQNVPDVRAALGLDRAGRSA